MLKDKDISAIREKFIGSLKPLIFFDDDPDGLCSFLQFYKLNSEAKGVIYKSSNPLDETFLKKVEEFGPDNIFILDVPKVSQDFIDGARNVTWIDHHTPTSLKGMKYYNPMINDETDNSCISYWSNKICKTSTWIAMVGMVSDWQLHSDLKEEFLKEFPDLMDKKIKKPEDALFNSTVGKLARIFSFILKGTTKDALTCVKIITRIKDPYEILNQTTAQGKYIYKKYKKIDDQYQELKSSVKVTKDKVIEFIYPGNKMALTSDLSNEILYENPKKFVIIGRDHNGFIKFSLRSSKYEVLPILQKAMKEVRGHGGGHLHACGGQVEKEDYPKFLEIIKKEL